MYLPWILLRCSQSGLLRRLQKVAQFLFQYQSTRLCDGTMVFSVIPLYLVSTCAAQEWRYVVINWNMWSGTGQTIPILSLTYGIFEELSLLSLIKFSMIIIVCCQIGLAPSFLFSYWTYAVKLLLCCSHQMQHHWPVHIISWHPSINYTTLDPWSG